VTNLKIADGAATSAKIGDAAVTNAKIADGAITSTKILDGAVGTADIADNAVTTAKVASGSITRAKIAADVGAPIAFGIVNSSGTCGARTPNVSVCTRIATGEYEITIAGESYSNATHVTLVTVLGDPAFIGTDANLGHLVVNVRTSSGSGGNANRAFQFVVYRP
jgi:hypothetical protein